jgi:hypothetical protein
LSSDDGQPFAVKDLVKDIFAAMTVRTQLDQLYPSPQPRLSRSALLTGWDLLELTNPIRSSSRLEVDLNAGDWSNSTPTWLHFASQVPTFFCDNAGKIMESALPLCSSFQHDKKHLIANVHVLGGLMTSCKNCQGYHVGTDKKWIWNVSKNDCFAPCNHEPGHIKTRDGNCFRNRIQLMVSEGHACEAGDVTSLLPEKGAVVFGSRMLNMKKTN